MLDKENQTALDAKLMQILAKHDADKNDVNAKMADGLTKFLQEKGVKIKIGISQTNEIIDFNTVLPEQLAALRKSDPKNFDKLVFGEKKQEQVAVNPKVDAADIPIPDSVKQAVHHNKPPPLLSSLNKPPPPPPPLPKRPSRIEIG